MDRARRLQVETDEPHDSAVEADRQQDGTDAGHHEVTETSGIEQRLETAEGLVVGLDGLLVGHPSYGGTTLIRQRGPALRLERTVLGTLLLVPVNEQVDQAQQNAGEQDGTEPEGLVELGLRERTGHGSLLGVVGTSDGLSNRVFPSQYYFTY